jgi:cbb3-type cytochrome oxidase subunit 3
MTYEALRSLAGMAGLLLFIGLFAAVLAYVFWPGNRDSFERARRLPLDADQFDTDPTEMRSTHHGR